MNDHSRTTLSIVIPCYNEEEGIENLHQQLKPVLEELEQRYQLQLILVDDGSTDKTNQLLHAFFKGKNTTIIQHPHNKNLGGALRTGFSAATGDLIAVLDSDCTYPPTLILPMITLLDKDTHIVTVSPYHPDGKIENITWHRLFLSKGASSIYRFLLNSGIYTHGAMARVYKKEVIKNIQFKADDFLSVTELLVKARLKNYTIKELPATFRLRQHGTSKMKLLKTIKSHLFLVGRIIQFKITGKEI